MALEYLEHNELYDVLFDYIKKYMNDNSIKIGDLSGDNAFIKRSMYFRIRKLAKDGQEIPLKSDTIEEICKIVDADIKRVYVHNKKS